MSIFKLYCPQKCFNDNKLMEFLTIFPDVIQIENLSSIIKKIYIYMTTENNIEAKKISRMQ